MMMLMVADKGDKGFAVGRPRKGGMLYGTVMISANSILALSYSCVFK